MPAAVEEPGFVDEIGLLAVSRLAVVESDPTVLAEFGADVLDFSPAEPPADPMAIWNGKEYWKTVLSASEVIWMPYVPSLPKEPSTAQLYEPFELSTPAERA